MSYELTGTIKVIGELQTFGSGFTKKEIVVTVPDGNYPQDISLEFLKEKAELLGALQVGQSVTVTFDVRGREYNGRYFNNLVGWKIDAEATDNAPAPSANAAPTRETGDPGWQQEDINDDIPF
ncbi:DUF3127 domain-containing protein [Litorivicinus lipolyticus]|uniref:DUF3127 domain-containing protein n=1 Tax=Litorivicinus lipolyticus TaxID=418701 RepID=UPI003B59BCC8